jgi:hypothetical protein
MTMVNILVNGRILWSRKNKVIMTKGEKDYAWETGKREIGQTPRW